MPSWAAGQELRQRTTLKWFSKELYLPSAVIDRGSLDAWEKKGARSAFERARDRARRLIGSYKPVPVPADVRRDCGRSRQPPHANSG